MAVGALGRPPGPQGRPPGRLVAPDGSLLNLALLYTLRTYTRGHYARGAQHGTVLLISKSGPYLV